ncbi:hypothetical protein AAF712_015806, partial [Marasmius tenuissimus]
MSVVPAARIPPEVDLAMTFEHEMLVRYFNAAGGVLWLYDAFLNLDLELRYIWASMNPRKSPVRLTGAGFNLLYLVQRYLPLFDRVVLDLY